MILTILLFYFISFTSSHEINLKESKIAIFKTYESDKFLINNIYYRESINRRFILPLNPGIYNLSHSNYELYNGQLSYGKPYNKNILLKPNISTKISSVYSYNIDEQYIYIFANIAQLFKKHINFMINHNGKEIYNQYGTNLDYFNIIKAEPGLNIISLLAMSKDYYCICPTMDKGFTHNYQLAIWNQTNVQHKEVLKNNDKISIKIPINIDNQLNNSEMYNHLIHLSY